MNVLNYLQGSVKKFPQKTAVACGNEAYTFLDIEKMSQSLAACVDREYVNKPIIVFSNRNAHVLILYLACIFSKNYYIPVDPDMPREKIQAIIDDSKPKYIFGDDETKAILNSVSFDGQFLTLKNVRGNKSAGYFDLHDDAPLYMIYTSGSTGKPKGVLKSHHALSSFVETYHQTFSFSSDDVIGNQTPFFFDASAKDIYLALKLGATLEIIPSQHFAMPVDLVEYLNNRKVTFISWVPTALSIVAQMKIFSYARPETLKRVFFVGEVMPVKHLNYWRENLPDIQFVNLYGQSEIAGICCYHEVEEKLENTDVLPMGKPLSNCKVYLLDGEQIIREAGKQGEMYIVSDALALEYFNDDEMNRKHFLIKDFGEGPVRCFKTGDLAAYDESGNLVFASRIDFQIKHRGHRIELGEIEAVAGSLSMIQRCCCSYDKNKQKLVLFCEIDSNSAVITCQQIKSTLKEHLSAYMMPERVVILNKMPLNANGKLDRKAMEKLL